MRGADDAFDLVLVGTGPASSFFLAEYLRHAPASARVLALERGPHRDHAWHLGHMPDIEHAMSASFVNATPDKPWKFNLAFGGSSNWWWACTPRMLPSDFELQSRFGVGVDWPLGYAELEPYYAEVEDAMAVSGPSDRPPAPRSRPFPQPPHRLNGPDLLLQQAYPDEFFAMPTARARVTTPTGRPGCCANHVCTGCPIDSKFTVVNEMSHLYRDPRVELRAEALVERLEVAGDTAGGVVYTQAGTEKRVRADLIGLGANAIFNPFLLQKSDLDGPEVGRGLVEQVSKSVQVNLAGVDSFDGSTSLTGHGYMLHRDEYRSRFAAALLETSNIPNLRHARGKWRQVLQAKFLYEDLRQPDNRVRVSREDPSKPEVTFLGPSGYALDGVAALETLLPELLAPLPVEEYRVRDVLNKTEAHVLGTCVMGRDPETSVVDTGLVHHRVRNVLVLGGSAFPTAAPANPTLTLSALSLRAARRLVG